MGGEDRCFPEELLGNGDFLGTPSHYSLVKTLPAFGSMVRSPSWLFETHISFSGAFSHWATPTWKPQPAVLVHGVVPGSILAHQGAFGK